MALKRLAKVAGVLASGIDSGSTCADVAGAECMMGCAETASIVYRQIHSELMFPNIEVRGRQRGIIL